MAFASLLLLGLCDNIRGPLFPEILYTFAVTDSQGSWFFAISSMAGFVGAYFGSWWIDKLGEMRSLQISIFLMCLSQVLISLAPSFQMLLLIVILFGFSLGLMGVMQNVLVVQGSPEAHKSKILSGLHSMYAASSLMAPLLVAVLLILPKSTYSSVELWRRAFQVTALCCFILGLIALRHKNSIAPHAVKKAVKKPREGRALRIYFAIILGSYVGAEILVSSRIALFLRREYAATLEESTWYTAAFFIGLLSGRILFSAWTPKMAVRRQMIISMSISTVLLILGLFVHPSLLALSGLAMAPFYPLMISWAGEIFHHQLAPAISLAVSFSSVSVVVMNVLMGAVSDWPGIRYGFMIGPLLCSIAIGMLFFYEKIFHRV